MYFKISKLILCIILLLNLSLSLSSQIDLIDDGTWQDEQYTGEAVDFVIPANTTYNSIRFDMDGGDGGEAVVHDCRSNGGAGATAKATFLLGHGPGQLKPGARLRFIVGGEGSAGYSNAPLDFSVGGGGGGTAVLYKPDDNTDWIILIVAGGGGGAYQGNILTGCVNSEAGQSARTTRNAGNGQGEFGGDGGDYSQPTAHHGGDAGGHFGDLSGGGGAAFDFGGSDNCMGGGQGYPDGGDGGCDDGGIDVQTGGWGFGGGGSGDEGGGGGGGITGGGGGGLTNNGGGGGSYINGEYAFTAEIIEFDPRFPSYSGIVLYRFYNTCLGQIQNIRTLNTVCDPDDPDAIVDIEVIPNFADCNLDQINYTMIKYEENSFPDFIQSDDGFFYNLTNTNYEIIMWGETEEGPIFLDTVEYTLPFIDLDPPNAVCNNITVNMYGDNLARPNFHLDIEGGSSDECSGIASLSASNSFFECDDVGDNSIILTVRDNVGNVSTCESIVTIQDATAPTFDNPFVGITIFLDENGEATLDLEDFNLDPALISDNCTSFEELYFNWSQRNRVYTCADVGFFNRYFDISDGNGNTTSIVFQLTIRDNTPPVPICKDITIYLDESGEVPIHKIGFIEEVTDNCYSDEAWNYFTIDGAEFITFDCQDTGIHDITVTSDHNPLWSPSVTSCTAQVTVVDSQAPVISCQDLTVSLDDSGIYIPEPADLFAGSFDNCLLESEVLDELVIASSPAFNCTDVGQTFTLYLVPAELAPEGSPTIQPCSSQLTIEDNIAPLLACHPVVTVRLSEEGTYTFQQNDILYGGIDNCGSVSFLGMDIPQVDCSHSEAPIVVTVTGVDGSGNTNTCTVGVVVEDNIAPVLNCTEDLTVGTDPLACDATITLPVPTYSDNCGVTVFRYRHRQVDDQNENIPGIGWSSWIDGNNPTVVLSMGRHKIRWRIEDAAGEKVDCEVYVQVVDNERPIASCRDLTLFLPSGGTNMTLEPTDIWDQASSSDNCSEVYFIGLSTYTFSCDQIGIPPVAVTVTLEDATGNIGECLGMVTLQGLPCEWQIDSNGLGCNAGAGNYDPSTETYSLSSEGCYDPAYYRANDQHGFIQRELCGDGEIIAQVTEVLGNGWAGISMRENNDPSAPMIQLMIDGVSLSRRELRQTVGGYAFAHVYQTQGKNWLRLSRTGNQFTASRSADGMVWEHVFITQIPMSNCIHFGLITMNGATEVEVTGIFENVTINGSAPVTFSIPTPDIDIAQGNTADFYMYPNPAAEVVNLHLEHFIGKDVQTRIYNQFGQIVFQQQWQEVSYATQQIDISNIQAGTYFVEISSGTERVSKKLVVTRL